MGDFDNSSVYAESNTFSGNERIGVVFDNAEGSTEKVLKNNIFSNNKYGIVIQNQSESINVMQGDNSFEGNAEGDLSNVGTSVLEEVTREDLVINIDESL